MFFHHQAAPGQRASQESRRHRLRLRRTEQKKVATLSKAKLMEVVNTKLPDLNTKDPERAARILAGQARQMGIEVEGM
ncbi:MAG: hypothetical protein ACLT38_11095 [Akkermansia sp.]